MIGKAKNQGLKKESAPAKEYISEDVSDDDAVDLSGFSGEVDEAVELTTDEDRQLNAETQSAMVEVDSEHLAQLELEAKQNYDKYLRTVAEFDNYKKRMIRERADLLKYAGESMARDLLEVLDDLERAIVVATEGKEWAETAAASSADFVTGVKLIKDRFVSIFDKHGIKGQSAVGQPFDPNTHQALASVPVPEVDPNLILEEFKKAYYFKDKLLRVGQAVVSAAPIE